MQVNRYYTFPQTFYWSRRFFVGPLIYGGLVVGAWAGLNLVGEQVPAAATVSRAMEVPWTVVSLAGVAVAFFVGFKNNASYGRLWEARMIWGAIVNTSRSWGMMVKDFVTDHFAAEPVAAEVVRAAHERLILRHVAWLTALRHQLRRDKSWEHMGDPIDEQVRASTPERRSSLEADLTGLISDGERTRVLGLANAATQLLALQSADLRALHRQGLIDDFRHMELEGLLVDLFTQQGKSERIKNFPFPRQYASFTLYSVYLLAALMPFGMLGLFEALGTALIWLAIPASATLSWVFFTAELIGDYSENPFEGLWNDIPISALSRTIEVDLREMIDLGDLPPPVEVDGFGLLM